MNKQGKILVVVLACALIAVSIGWAVSSSSNGGNFNQVVATVNGQKITKNQLYDFMVKQNGVDAAYALVNEKIVLLEAEKANINVSDAEVQKEFEHYYESYGGKEIFEQAVAASGVTEESMEHDIRLYLTIKKLLEPRISITEEEMQDYFAENKYLFATEEEVKASHILVETEELAKEIKGKLDEGADFAELAKEYSTDDANKDFGGALGFFPRGIMAQEFEDAAFSMTPGSISNPVKTDFGYHIIKLEEKREAQEPTYEDKKEDIKDYLTNEKIQIEYSSWQQEVYSQYDIDILLGK